MTIEVALDTFQASKLGCPRTIDDGEAVNDVMTGTA